MFGDSDARPAAPLIVALSRLGFLALLLALWWLASQSVTRNIIPTPYETALAAERLWSEGRLPSALVTSLATFLGGFGLAVMVALPLGMVMGACSSDLRWKSMSMR